MTSISCSRHTTSCILLLVLFLYTACVDTLTPGEQTLAAAPTHVEATTTLWITNATVATNADCSQTKPCLFDQAITRTYDNGDYLVHMPSGVYPFQMIESEPARLRLLGNGTITWRGSGRDQVTLQCTGNLTFGPGKYPDGGLIPFSLSALTRLHLSGITVRDCGWVVVAIQGLPRTSQIHIDDCAFLDGGNSILSTGDAVTITNSVFQGNRPRFYAKELNFLIPSTVFSLARSLAITKSSFIENVVSTEAGSATKSVVYVLTDLNQGPTNTVITQCRFIANVGMIFLSEGNATVTDSEFSRNVDLFAERAHLMYFFREQLVVAGRVTRLYFTLRNLTISRNKYIGVLIRMDSGNTMSLSQSTFSHNSAAGHFGNAPPEANADGNYFTVDNCTILDDKLSAPTISVTSTAGNSAYMVIRNSKIYAAMQATRFGDMPIIAAAGHYLVYLDNVLLQAPSMLVTVEGAAIVNSTNSYFHPQDSVSGSPGLVMSPAVILSNFGSFFSSGDRYVRMNWEPGTYNPSSFIETSAGSPGVMKVQGAMFDLRYHTTGVIVGVAGPESSNKGCDVSIEDSLFYFGGRESAEINGMAALRVEGPTSMTVSSCQFSGFTKTNVASISSSFARVLLANNVFTQLSSSDAQTPALITVAQGTLQMKHNDFVNYEKTALACLHRDGDVTMIANRFSHGNVTGFSPSAYQVASGCAFSAAADSICSLPGVTAVVCDSGARINGSISADPAMFHCQSSTDVLFAPGAAVDARHLLLCPEQPVVLGIDQDDITGIFASSQCHGQGDYSKFIASQLQVPPKYLPPASSAFPSPSSTCQGATRTISLQTPVTNTSNDTTVAGTAISVQSGFQSATAEKSILVLTSSQLVMVDLDVRIESTSIFVPNTLIGLPSFFMNLFLFTNREYTFTATFRNQFGYVLALPQDTNVTLQMQSRSKVGDTFPATGQTPSREQLLFKVKTPSDTGSYSVYSVVLAQSSPAVQITLVWIGWVAIAICALAGTVIIPVTILVYRRLKKSRKSLLQQQYKLVERLLTVERKDIEDAHTRYLGFYEVTRLPHLFFIDKACYVHAVCESPGHWHLVEGLRSATPVPHRVADSLRQHQQLVRHYLREFPPQQPEDGTGYVREFQLLSDDLPWFTDHSKDPSVLHATLTNTTTISAPSTADTTMTAEEGSRPSQSSEGDLSKYIRGIVKEHILPLLRHPSYHHKLRRVLLKDDRFCWSCPEHPHIPSRPYDLSIGLRSQMTRLAPNVASFDIDLSSRSLQKTHSSQTREVIDMVMGELHRQEWGRNLQVKRIRVLHNRYLATAFRQRDRILGLESRHRLAHPWPEDGKQPIRKAMSEALSSHVARVRDDADVSMLDPSNLDLVWHGANGGEDAIVTIAQTGFMSLSLLNTGWYGRGVYFTHYPEYAEFYAPVSEAASGDCKNKTAQGERMLVLSWVILGQTYPVVSRIDRATDPEHDIHGGFPGHDSHYTVVRPGGAPMEMPSRSDIQQGIVDVQTGQFDEVVVWQENQILPQFVVYYQHSDNH